jgi:hydroxymethylbilane synthase
MLEFLGVLADGPTTLACSAERSLLKTLQGGCSAPVGVETSWERKTLVLKSSVISPDGKKMVEARCQDEVASEEQAVKLGRELAEKLLEMGADLILKEIRDGAAQ